MLSCPPEFLLPDYLKEPSSVDYTAEYFEPAAMKVPPIELHTPSNVLKDHHEDIWYINIVSDSVFDYRAVELPFDVIDSIWPPFPPRNLTESEWRSIGITQSKGWENYHRPCTEKNVLLFRRLRDGVDISSGKSEILHQLQDMLETMKKLLVDYSSQIFTLPICLCEQVRNGFHYPMLVFDPDMRSLFGLSELDKSDFEYRAIVSDGSVAFSTSQRLVEFQIKVIEFSINQLKN
jgi:cyclin-dependent kinase regulatory subunit CKS1